MKHPPATPHPHALHQPIKELVVAAALPEKKRCKARNVHHKESVKDSLRRGWPGPVSR